MEKHDKIQTLHESFILFFIFFLLFNNAGQVFAASLPQFSMSSYCKEVSEAVGGSYQIEQGCMENEESSLNELSRMDVPERIINYCREVAESVGGSYQIMHGCVQNELEAKGQLNQ
jgi:hypothetical protein